MSTNLLKEHILKRIKLSEISVAEAAKRYDVSIATIYRWLKLSEKGMNKPKAGSHKNTPLLPRGATIDDAHFIVQLQLRAGSEQLGHFMRQYGFTPELLKEWKAYFQSHKNVLIEADSLSVKDKTIDTLRTQVAKLNKVIDKKDKALAMSHEMLMLSKKAEAIFGVSEED